MMMMMRMMIRIRIINERKLRIIQRVNIVITIVMKIMRMANGMRTIRMIMKLIKTMIVTGMKRFRIIIIRIIIIVRVITVITRMRISVMTVEI